MSHKSLIWLSCALLLLVLLAGACAPTPAAPQPSDMSDAGDTEDTTSADAGGPKLAVV